VALALLVAGCAKPPVAEQKAAQSAKDTAVTAQAEAYAAKTMDDAKQAWDKAEAGMQKKSYTEAKAAYVLATTTFEKAVAEVAAGKAAVIAENQAALKNLEGDWKTLNTASKKEAKKLKGAEKQSWQADAKVITAALKKAKNAAVDPAELKQDLTRANQLVEKWLTSWKKK
jgi:hypothetical protein